MPGKYRRSGQSRVGRGGGRGCPNRSDASRLPRCKPFPGDHDAASQETGPCRQEDRSAGEACRKNSGAGHRENRRIARQGGCAREKAAAPAETAAAAKAVPQATITLKHIAAELAEAHDLSKKAAEAVLDDFVALVTRQLVKGDKIRLSSLGILQVRDRPARTGRNPRTGESVAVAASRKIAFRPAKELKTAV
nr:HU family DNA-binding protein [uncultured Rhodopila sp.]